MASLTHMAAGAVLGAVYARRTGTEPAHAITAFALLALAPDLDFLAAGMEVRGSPLDHRAMTHSLAFAVALGVAVGMAVGRGRRRLLTAALGVAALASHGILDAATDTDPGPQLLWPLSAAPIEFGWQPIPGTERFEDYFTTVGLPVLATEGLFCLPLLAIAALVLFVRLPPVGRAEPGR